METASSAAQPLSSAPVSPVMTMLQDHLPLTLLLDLAFGVRSQELYDTERADLSWLRPAAVA